VSQSTRSLLMGKELKSPTCRGRPRCFDLDEALDRSMVLFWQNGFQNTSLDEIADAVGVKKPSLYAAFGDKEMLFRQVLQRYAEKFGQPFVALRQHDDIRAAVNAYLDAGITCSLGQGTPRGCLLASAFADCELFPATLATEVRALVAKADRAMAQRLQKAVDCGQLAADFDVKGTAKFLNCLVHGIALRARAGEKNASLQSVKAVALRCLGQRDKST
jgi:TetR/AcrR family transcriptional regulator, copper-responsive repressor